MTKEEMAALMPGDLIQNIGSGNGFIVAQTDPLVVVRVMTPVNAPEWKLVAKGAARSHLEVKGMLSTPTPGKEEPPPGRAQGRAALWMWGIFALLLGLAAWVEVRSYLKCREGNSRRFCASLILR